VQYRKNVKKYRRRTVCASVPLG